MANINIELTNKLHKKLKIHCADKEVNMKDQVIQFIEQGIKK